MKTSFAFFWLGNTNLLFRNITTRVQCEVVFSSNKPEGAIETGLIADGYFSDEATGLRYQ